MNDIRLESRAILWGKFTMVETAISYWYQQGQNERKSDKIYNAEKGMISIAQHKSYKCKQLS